MANSIALHASEEANYAPVLPIRAATETDVKPNAELTKWVKGVRDKHWQLRSDTWDQKALIAQKNEWFYRGYHRLRKATYGNYMRPLDPNPIHVSINVFRFWSDLITTKWVSSTADLDVLPSSDDDHQVAASKKAENIVDFYASRHYTQIARILESKRGQFEGNLARYVYYDSKAGVKAKRDVIEDQSIQLAPAAAMCADCGYGGTQEEFSGLNTETGQAHLACISCGSPNVLPIDSPTINAPVVTGQEEVEVGDIKLRNVSIYNLRYDVEAGLEGSDWLIWEEYYDRDVCDALYPNLKKVTDQAIDTQLAAKDALAFSSPQSGATADRVKLTRIWLRPTKYPSYRIDHETETVSGVIPKGTYLIDFCPKGAYFALVGDILVDLRPEDKDDHWCGTGYHILPNSGVSDGIEDMCEPQKNLNTVKGLINVWMRHNASPAGFYNPLLVDGNDWSGNPGEIVPIKHENLGLLEGMDYTKAAWFVPTPPMSPGVFQYGQMMTDDLQLTAHNTEYSGGLPNVSNRTATGAEITQSLAQAIHTTQLAQRAYLDAKTAKIVLKLFRRFCWDSRWIQLKGKDGDFAGEYLSAADIDYEFEVEPVLDSWLPRTKLEKQRNLERAIDVIGRAGGFAMMPPELIAEIADTYSVDFGNDKFHQAVRMARHRVDMLTRAVPGLMPLVQLLPPTELVEDPVTGQMIEVPVDPIAEIGAAAVEGLRPRFNPRELGHEEAIQYLRAWFLTDEGIKADEAVIAAVNALLDLHIEALGLEMATRAQIGALAQPPMPVMPAQDADGPPRSEQDKRKDSAAANLGQGPSPKLQTGSPKQKAAGQ